MPRRIISSEESSMEPEAEPEVVSGEEMDVEEGDDGEEVEDVEVYDEEDAEGEIDEEDAEEEGEDGDVDVEEGEEDEDAEGEEDEEDEENEEDEDAGMKGLSRGPSELDDLSSLAASPAPAPSETRTGLKITLKRPPQKASSSRGGRSNVGLESEDSSDEIIGGSSRPLTARQAVLASGVDPAHVTLTPEPSKKKKHLNEAELALRREETARKRKHLSEKKLEDEKAETINRLLKKQSRPRGKRSALATADDRTPASRPNTGTGVAGTPADEDDESMEPAEVSVQEPPTCWRWVSSTTKVAGAMIAAEGSDAKIARNGEDVVMNGNGQEEGTHNTVAVEGRKMVLSFSIPVSILPPPPEAIALHATSTGMDVDAPQQPTRLKTNKASLCDVAGCGKGRKYRLVKDWERGACGMEHLKALEVS